MRVTNVIQTTTGRMIFARSAPVDASPRDLSADFLRVARVWHAARMEPETQAAAIVLAAGAGTRLGAERPKAFLPIGGRPMLAVAAAAAAASPRSRPSS